MITYINTENPPWISGGQAQLSAHTVFYRLVLTGISLWQCLILRQFSQPAKILHKRIYFKFAKLASQLQTVPYPRIYNLLVQSFPLPHLTSVYQATTRNPCAVLFLPFWKVNASLIFLGMSNCIMSPESIFTCYKTPDLIQLLARESLLEELPPLTLKRRCMFQMNKIKCLQKHFPCCT